jgi:hypothetical protein
LRLFAFDTCTLKHRWQLSDCCTAWVSMTRYVGSASLSFRCMTLV